MTKVDSISDVAGLVDQLFANRWVAMDGPRPFADRKLSKPGVYLIAYSKMNLLERRIALKDVFCVGMTCSSGGLRGRLQQFLQGIEGRHYHSGAIRFYREFAKGRKYSELKRKNGKLFYFAALPFDCVAHKGKAKPRDFRQLGHVSCLEYYAIAKILEKTGKKPRLNKLGPMVVV